MRIGVPSEIKIHEYRVGLMPSGVRELVNGGHTYGTLLQVVHDNAIYAEGMSLKVALTKKDKAAENPNLAQLIEDDEKLAMTEVQKMTDQHIEQVNEILKKKESEIMAV